MQQEEILNAFLFTWRELVHSSAPDRLVALSRILPVSSTDHAVYLGLMFSFTG
jgi:hypothetical protein